MFATLFLALALTQAPGATAQSPTAMAAATAAIAAAPGPAACVTALQAFVPKRQQEVRTATGFTSELLKQVNDEKLALAKSCLARFDAATVKPSQLPGLSELLIAAGQAEEGRAALTRNRIRSSLAHDQPATRDASSKATGPTSSEASAARSDCSRHRTAR